MELNWERIYDESKRTLIALLYYIGAGVIIFGAILLAYYTNKNQYFAEIHNRFCALIGAGLMLVGTLGYFGNKLKWEHKAFTDIFAKTLLGLFYFSGTFCIALSILRSN